MKTGREMGAPAWRHECADDEDRFDDWSLDVPGAATYGRIIEGDDVAAIVCAETDAGYKRRKALILAAPDLLQALKAMAARFILPRNEELDRPVWEAVCAAIKKAES